MRETPSRQTLPYLVEQPPESPEALTREWRELLALVQPLLRPSLAAELQERIWRQTELLQTLQLQSQPTPPPLVTRPRSLPQPLNPFYFIPKRHAP